MSTRIYTARKTSDIILIAPLYSFDRHVKDTFAWFEAVLGIFHLQTDVYALLCSNIWGSKIIRVGKESIGIEDDDDSGATRINKGYKQVGTLSNLTKRVGNTQVRKKLRDFRATQHFLKATLEGHLMALLFTAFEVKDKNHLRRGSSKRRSPTTMIHLTCSAIRRVASVSSSQH